MERQLIEFKELPFKRDEFYFSDGYASWEVKVHNKTYTVNAIYSNEELIKNEKTKDYLNGIKGFELQTPNLKTLKTFKVPLKSKIISLEPVEEYLKKYF